MFNRKTDQIADGVRLLAAVGATAADPTLLSALRSGPGAYDALRRLAASPPPGVAWIADALGAEARALFDAARDLPPDAEALFPQMVEAGLIAAPDIVAASMDPAAVSEAMLARMTAPEHRTAAMVGLFRALTVPVLTRLLADSGFADDLRAAFMAEVLRRLGDLGSRLEAVDRLTRLEMTALGDRFEIPRMHALSDADLREALEKKAEEYRSYRAQIEAIDERTAGLGNLKAAAREAAERLDFDEVEALLSREHEVELEIAAETAVVRAENALLRGRTEDEFAMLSAAADGFASVSHPAMAEKRIEYATRIFWHGDRYGGVGLELAAKMFRRAAREANNRDLSLCAEAQNGLGIATRSHGERLGGKAGATLLTESIEACSAALRIWSKVASPEKWAAAKSNLSGALSAQAKLASGAEAIALSHQAVASVRASLEVWNEADHRVLWAVARKTILDSRSRHWRHG